MTYMLARIFEPLGALIKPPSPARVKTHEFAPDHNSTLLVRDTQGKYEQKISLQIGVEIEIGRYLGSPITSSRPRYELPNAAVSAKHAYMGLDATGVYIIDIGTEGTGSRNGTFVNGARIQPCRKFYLNPDDEIWLGKPHGPMSERLTVNNDGDHKMSVSFQTFAAR